MIPCTLTGTTTMQPFHLRGIGSILGTLLHYNALCHTAPTGRARKLALPIPIQNRNRRRNVGVSKSLCDASSGSVNTAVAG